MIIIVVIIKRHSPGPRHLDSPRPARSLQANLRRGLGNSYQPAGIEVLISASRCMSTVVETTTLVVDVYLVTYGISADI